MANQLTPGISAEKKLRTILGNESQELINTVLYPKTDRDWYGATAKVIDIIYQQLKYRDTIQTLMAELREASSKGRISHENVNNLIQILAENNSANDYEYFARTLEEFNSFYGLN